MLEFGEESVQNHNEHIREGMMLEVFTVAIDSLHIITYQVR